MLAALSRSSRVVVALARSSAPVSTTSIRLIDDPDQALKRKEAWRIDNEMAVLLPEEKQQHNVEVSRTVTVPSIPNLSPVTGIPEEHVRTRRVRIYMPPKNAMQSGTNNINFWQMEFDNRQRWENPLMGWSSTGDPLSNLKIEFQTKEAAIEHCEKHGWAWYIDEGKFTKEEKPKSYGVNFSWNRRTRVSTK